MKKFRIALRRFPPIVLSWGAFRSAIQTIARLPVFILHGLKFAYLNTNDRRFKFSFSQLYPCLTDSTEATGFDRHYTFHTAWAARVLAAAKPTEHTDIGSAIYFSTIVSAFLPVRFYDVRLAPISLTNLTTGAADLTQLPFPSASIESMSCMHVLEHIGLGRYGDKLDPAGDLKAIAELKRVMRPQGHLLIVVPIGATPRIQFNAHRIYTKAMIENYFGNHFTLNAWALIPDSPADGDLLENPPFDLLRRQFYGCGCFCFRKHD